MTLRVLLALCTLAPLVVASSLVYHHRRPVNAPQRPNVQSIVQDEAMDENQRRIAREINVLERQLQDLAEVWLFHAQPYVEIQ